MNGGSLRLPICIFCWLFISDSATLGLSIAGGSMSLVSELIACCFLDLPTGFMGAFTFCSVLASEGDVVGRGAGV
jgi:hypothetical protein